LDTIYIFSLIRSWIFTDSADISIIFVFAYIRGYNLVREHAWLKIFYLKVILKNPNSKLILITIGNNILIISC